MFEKPRGAGCLRRQQTGLGEALYAVTAKGKGRGRYPAKENKQARLNSSSTMKRLSALHLCVDCDSQISDVTKERHQRTRQIWLMMNTGNGLLNLLAASAFSSKMSIVKIIALGADTGAPIDRQPHPRRGKGRRNSVLDEFSTLANCCAPPITNHPMCCKAIGAR
jgi:hypothetical protein